MPGREWGIEVEGEGVTVVGKVGHRSFVCPERKGVIWEAPSRSRTHAARVGENIRRYAGAKRTMLKTSEKRPMGVEDGENGKGLTRNAGRRSWMKEKRKWEKRGQGDERALKESI